jgi:uncharacterized protein (TIGR02145 family)
LKKAPGSPNYPLLCIETNQSQIMRLIYLLLFVVIFHLSAAPQAPAGFTYQAVARDVSGAVLPDQAVSFHIFILQDSPGGESVFDEKHFTETNQFGLVTLTIGQGEEQSGELLSINWAEGPYFLKVNFDPDGGYNFLPMGVNQLLSVPYALYAEQAGTGGSSLPQVQTFEAADVTAKEATLSGHVISDGGEVVLLRGICWSTSPNPTTADTINGNGVGRGAFESKLSDLDDTTTYYVRAFATNRLGTAYGNQIEFTTMPLTGTLTDIDGNVYSTIMIGPQIWMAENLRVSRYYNGDSIAGNLSNSQWSAANYGAHAFPGNNPENNEIYGKLYNWFAVNDSRGLCPEGWTVPADEDWAELVSYLGGALAAGGKLKSTRTVPDPHPRWDQPNTDATNESGFTAFPAGDRFTNGLYYNFGRIGTFWSSTESNIASAWVRSLSYASGSMTRNGNDKRYGFSVRCLMVMEK